MKCEICGKIIWLWQNWTSKSLHQETRKRWDYNGFTFWEPLNEYAFAHKKCVKRKVEEEQSKKAADMILNNMEEWRKRNEDDV